MKTTKYFRSVWFITILIIVFPLIIYAVVNRYKNRFEALPVFPENSVFAKTGFNTSYAQLEFYNQEARIISFDKLNQKIILVNFFFTHCPGICLKMMTNEKKLQQILSRDTDICFLSFSVDPNHDSIPVLARYARLLDIGNDQWHLMTGDKRTIYQLARKKFNLSATEGDGGPEDFIHSDQLVLLDQKRQIRGYYNGTDPETISQLLTDIKKLENEK
ncbi:MAG TPA: SCO family protein [Puia sp.]|jgi:protein SCO1/2